MQFKEWLRENETSAIYVDTKGHLVSPDENALKNFAQELASAGVSVIPDRTDPNLPHYDLVDDTEGSVEMAQGMGAILMSPMALMRLMRQMGVWKKSTPEARQKRKDIKLQKPIKYGPDWWKKYLVTNENVGNIKIIDVREWPEGKIDPTEYSPTTDTIHIRSDYGMDDPAGWIVHEKVHAANKKLPQWSDDYPNNQIERLAYVAQFKYLISEKGCQTLDDVFKIPTMGHKAQYRNILQRYFDEAM
jgi:hypothetical protein